MSSPMLFSAAGLDFGYAAGVFVIDTARPSNELIRRRQQKSGDGFRIGRRIES
jgi:hypothetical protein